MILKTFIKPDTEYQKKDLERRRSKIKPASKLYDKLFKKYDKI